MVRTLEALDELYTNLNIQALINNWFRKRFDMKVESASDLGRLFLCPCSGCGPRRDDSIRIAR